MLNCEDNFSEMLPLVVKQVITINYTAIYILQEIESSGNL